MSAERSKPDIGKVFADGHLIDEAIQEGVHRALLEHKRAGNPVTVGGMAQWSCYNQRRSLPD